MKESIFSQLGRCIYHHKILVLILWVFLIAGCLPFLPNIVSPFKTTGFVDNNSLSAKTDTYLNNHLNYYHNRFLILYSSKTLTATDNLFTKKIKYSLRLLPDLKLKYIVVYPTVENKQISKDKHSAYALVAFKDNKPLTSEQLSLLQEKIQKPKNMMMLIGSEAIFVEGVGAQTQKDLYKADIIAAPVAIITLILVFGSIVAALIPMLLGGGSALLILTLLFFIGHVCTLSIFTLNIALLLGLCLSLDYSLFIISRFREELISQNAEDALAITMQTAGQAVFFSGLAVFISLSALLIFPITILYSIGIGGLVAVFIAMSSALLILPALLALLQQRAYIWPVRLFKNKRWKFQYWQWLSTAVIKHALIYFFLIAGLLVLLGLPFLKVNFGLSDYRILPKNAESRRFFDDYAANFNENSLNPILLIISADKHLWTAKNINSIYELRKKLTNNPLIAKVSGVIDPTFASKKTYRALLTATNPSAELKKSLLLTGNKKLTVISITSHYPINSSLTHQLIQQLKKIKLNSGLLVSVTGVPVTNADVLININRLYPYALLWIGLLTYLILLFLLRSLFLPLKAIIMNIMSLCASYGILVFVFQEGHFHQWLNFDPQGILDISLLIIIFCALFGFSMDYEVFLLTRIKEAYSKTRSNSESIIFGIVHSSKLITSAALIVILLCGSFMVADVLVVKQFGLGIAVAIFVDAFLVRSILVPATMALIKSWNWYLPQWLNRLLPKLPE